MQVEVKILHYLYIGSPEAVRELLIYYLAALKVCVQLQALLLKGESEIASLSLKVVGRCGC
jgi:hypothetical protein